MNKKPILSVVQILLLLRALAEILRARVERIKAFIEME